MHAPLIFMIQESVMQRFNFFSCKSHSGAFIKIFAVALRVPLGKENHCSGNLIKKKQGARFCVTEYKCRTDFGAVTGIGIKK